MKYAEATQKLREFFVSEDDIFGNESFHHNTLRYIFRELRNESPKEVSDEDFQILVKYFVEDFYDSALQERMWGLVYKSDESSMYHAMFLELFFEKFPTSESFLSAAKSQLYFKGKFDSIVDRVWYELSTLQTERYAKLVDLNQRTLD